MFNEDDLLPLSGLQHVAFCERQWALIHIEQIWAENRLTEAGRLLHERAHEEAEEARHDLLIARGLPVHSFRLGLSGRADVVEFSRVSSTEVPNTTQLPNRAGWWKPQPVEYKRGRAKREACDRVQLCAQALCLEEMFGLEIAEGALFYGGSRRRTAVSFSSDLRGHTEALATRMHDLFKCQTTPRAVLIPGCKSCSLNEQCQPAALSRPMPVERYILRAIET